MHFMIFDLPGLISCPTTTAYTPWVLQYCASIPAIDAVADLTTFNLNDRTTDVDDGGVHPHREIRFVYNEILIFPKPLK